MRRHRHRGFKLVELMVLILVIAILLGITVPAIQSSRSTAHRPNCQNIMRFLGLGLIQFQNSKNRFPNAGTFHDEPEDHQGDPLKSTIYRAITSPGAYPGDSDSWLHSWVIDVSPYLDAADLYNEWDKEKSYLSTYANENEYSTVSNFKLGHTWFGILRCPDDLTVQPGCGNLSYVVNGGFARWHAVPVGWSGSPTDGRASNGDVLRWAAPGSTWQDSQAIGKKLGVMFLGTHTGDQPWDIATSPADIADGAANTLLVGENTLAGYSKGTRYSGGRETNFACPLPNFAMFLASDDVCRTTRSAGDCLGGQLRPGPRGSSGGGWTRANRSGTFENINDGQVLTLEGSFPFANSGHPGGANFAFCDGAVRFLSSTIDGAVYAELISPAGTLLPPQIRQSRVNINQVDP